MRDKTCQVEVINQHTLTCLIWENDLHIGAIFYEIDHLSTPPPPSKKQKTNLDRRTNNNKYKINHLSAFLLITFDTMSGC